MSHPSHLRGAAPAAFLLALLAGTPVAAQEAGRRVLTADDYNRAAQMLSWSSNLLVTGTPVNPTFIGDGDRFWYRTRTDGGYTFYLVDPRTAEKRPAFDHDRLAAAMSMAADTSYVGRDLPFESFRFVDGETALEADVGERTFTCDLGDYTCVTSEKEDEDETRPFVANPDSTWEAFVQDHDLYMRPFGGGDTIRLTFDGEEYHAYGLDYPSPSQQRSDRPRRPDVRWAPDGTRLLVSRNDERDVLHMHYLSMTSHRPKHYERPYALPGDSVVTRPGFHLLDVSALMEDPSADPRTAVRNVAAQLDPVPFRLNTGGSPSDSLWSGSDAVHVDYWTRGAKAHYLVAVDATTGESRILAGDSAKTNVVGLMWSGGPTWHVTRDGQDVLWWSERTGWANLWHYDGRDHVLNPVTSGAWHSAQILHVDEAGRRLWFIGRGREEGVPYYARIYRVNFDGSGLTLLTPEDANHDVEFTPSGDHFVDTYSRIETPPVTVLRAGRDGSVTRGLEEADVSDLVEAGWRPGEVFTAKARDGVTDLWGVVYWPPDLDTTKKYPVIDHIYPGPFTGSVGSWSFAGGGEEFALAQLGFVVVEIEHMGSMWRSKAFHDNYYGNMGDNGIPDHVAVIKELAARYPFLDLEHVGIYGHSGGGFASTDAILSFPDFFEVAVSGSGNHDQRTYGAYWGETYQGLLVKDSVGGGDNYDSQSNPEKAKNLEGHLLLMHGDMDDNVHPAMTIQVVNELIKANKDFDLIIAPDRGHGLNEPYFIRRRWDYFVRWLLGAEPPREFEIVRPEG